MQNEEPEKVSISILGPETIRTDISGTSLAYNGSIKVELIATNECIHNCNLIVNFNGWDNFEPQEFTIGNIRNTRSEQKSFFLAPIALKNRKLFTLKTDERLQISAHLVYENREYRENKVVTCMTPAQLEIGISPVYSVVFQQNQFDLINTLEVSNRSNKPFGLTRVLAECDPSEFETATWNFDSLPSDQATKPQSLNLQISPSTLEKLTEKREISITFSVMVDNQVVCQQRHTVQLLPKNQWGGEIHMPELLGAFVTPNTEYTNYLIKKSSALLEKYHGDSRLDGYQSQNRQSPWRVAAALWSVISEDDITYCQPPASFAKGGQKIRLSHDIAKNRLSTCLDTALLFASCLEQAGLNPIVVLLEGHALVGLWLINHSFTSLTLTDPAELRNRLGLSDCILFETTLATSSTQISFEKAIREGKRRVSEAEEEAFIYAIDIKQARSRNIHPLEFGDGEINRTVTKAEREEIPLPVAPNLPPVEQDYTIDQETPQTRVDQWRRKLLDLSKRNPLINIKSRAAGFRILCPDIGKLEDQLASEEEFTFDSIESSKTQGRNDGRFTTVTGESLKSEFVSHQLAAKKLVADCSIKELEKQLITLFRKSKTDLEEGGSNTLFLALGTLRWKEDVNSDNTYRAPLILLPVSLKRSSAKARPRLSQHNAEGAVFNLTLIQMLKQDFEIDLSVFQNELPKDDSGIDCGSIWSVVRSRIKDSPGFEVVEELVLGTFSFAKYLMWKDLSDRIDDLKQSSLVDHLVERPEGNYPTKADFLNPEKVDDTIEPSQLYAPLNADSSQIVAIEASTRGVDFVLEGPPGTGKSETIANIIAHNLAIGKKVLFVSEKMVALDVVYSRLKSVGLGHLCLELHSNKASPKNVKDQLNEAWQRREEAPKSEWKEKAIQLGKQRRQLNNYVRALHKESPLGYSPYQAISKSSKYGQPCKVDLGWELEKPPYDLHSAPIKTKVERDAMFKMARDLGLAYKDVIKIDTNVFRLVAESSWSNQWNFELINKAKELVTDLECLCDSQSNFLELLAFEGSLDLTLNINRGFKNLAVLILDAIEKPLHFALAENAESLFERLSELVELKQKLNEVCDITWTKQGTEKLSKICVNEWNDRLTQVCPQLGYEDCRELAEEIESLGFQLELSSSDTKRIERLIEKTGVKIPREKIAILPVKRWIATRDEIAEKNIFIKALGKRKLSKTICSHGLDKPNYIDVLDDLDKLAESISVAQYNGLKNLIERLSEVASISKKIESIITLFDHPKIKDRSVPLEQILEIKKLGAERLDTIRSYAQHSKNPKRLEETIRRLLQQPENSNLRANSKKLINDVEQLEKSHRAFCLSSKAPTMDTMLVSEIKNLLSDLADSSHMLNPWCRWLEHREKAESYGLKAIIKALESGTIQWSETEEQTERALCKWATPLILDSSDVLKQFNATKHDDIINTFRDLDKEVAETTGAYIAALLASGLPEKEGPDAPHEYGVLSRELQRKRNQMSVRNLIEELGDFLLDLMPCFMMSPLSVAQYLPASYRSFDLVVFDEASQITVWDAIGAIARGKNAIIVGDPKQMPPSNTFGRQHEFTDDQEEDLESILDQAIAVGAGHHRLTGHYRSRHESLITFSNYKYYAGTLTTYPAPSDRESMVNLKRIDGLYTRGSGAGGGTNPIEAQAVVSEVIRRLNDPVLSEQSIGIVTFNAQQKQLIDNLLDEARRSNPKLEGFFNHSTNEPVFVKNLETVQGDQRDVIILSVTFGPTEPGAVTMSLNFGPMNKAGGERRLNVAATRATLEMIIFSSFDPSMIDLSRTSAQGMKDLKEFMNFAAKGPSSLARTIDHNTGIDQFDSPFEADVASQLRKRGWNIQTQVGASKFKIDMGVYNPNESGSFLAGIECDGATYHSSPTARDRDRVRHIILENLGWNLIRIWSTDYFYHNINHDRNGNNQVIERVHDELNLLLEADSQRREEEKAAQEATEKTPPANILKTADAEDLQDSNKHEVGAVETDYQFSSEFKDASIDRERIQKTEIEDPELYSTNITHVTNKGEIHITPYTRYNGDPAEDPRNARASIIAKKLTEIVKQENPVTVGRAYKVYLGHCGIAKMGKNVREALESGLQFAVAQASIEKVDEQKSENTLHTTLRIPGAHDFILRTRGPRELEEIPPSEIRKAAEFALQDDYFEKGSDAHCKRILEIFDTKRLTVKTSAIIKDALSGHNLTQ